MRLLAGRALYQTVLLDGIARARESVWIGTADAKDVHVAAADHQGRRASFLALLGGLARRGVELRLLSAKLPSRRFRASFDRRPRLVGGGLSLRLCPRVHFKVVIVDGARLYLGSANWTPAGLGARSERSRNFELGVWTEQFEPIDRATALYESVWSGQECRRCLLKARCPDPIAP